MFTPICTNLNMDSNVVCVVCNIYLLLLLFIPLLNLYEEALLSDYKNVFEILMDGKKTNVRLVA